MWVKNSIVSFAEEEKLDVVTKSPLLALCRSRLPKKSRIAPDPILLPGAYRFA
nr:hypothetical protein [Cylindrospermopsis raciborskii]